MPTDPHLPLAPRPLMIPGQWEARRRPDALAAAAAMPPVAPAWVDVGSSAASTGQPPSRTQKSELPRWLQIVVFTTILLALTLLAMWGSRPSAL